MNKIFQGAFGTYQKRILFVVCNDEDGRNLMHSAPFDNGFAGVPKIYTSNMLTMWA
jgi:hypothetical protein